MDHAFVEAITDSGFFRFFYDETDAGEEFPAKSGLRIERHSAREILLVVSGATSFVLDGKYHLARPGSVFFIDQWVPHKLGYLPEESDFMHIWLHLRKRELYAGLLHVADGVKRGYRDMILFPLEIYCLINKRWDTMKNSQEMEGAKHKYQKSMIQLLCSEMELSEAIVSSKAPTNNEIIEKVQNYIDINCGRNSSIAELEQFSGYNRYYLMRLFKAQTGLTILQYINQVRRGITSDALDRNISQKEIAYQLGFSSPAAFWLWKKRNML
jgi:AraC-like DNA-binding protein